MVRDAAHLLFADAQVDMEERGPLWLRTSSVVRKSNSLARSHGALLGPVIAVQRG